MYLGLIYSIILHICMLLVMMFGIDYTKKIQSQEETIVLELIPISTITNIKTTINDIKQVDQKKELISKNNVKQDNKTVLKDSDFDNPNVSQKTDIEKIENKSEPKIEQLEKEIKLNKAISVNDKKEKIPTKEIKEEQKLKKQNKDIIKPKKESIKQVDQKDKKKSEKQKKTANDDLANAVLKSLQEGGKKTSKTNKTQTLDDIFENAIKGDTTTDYNSEGDLSMSEIAAIRSQISQAWQVTAFSGGQDNKNLQVTVHVIVEESGDVKDIKIKNKSLPNGINIQTYNAFIDSVIRAIRTASPLKHLPSNKYDSWNEMELIFDSSGMIY